MIIHTICIFLWFLIFLGFALFLLLNNHNIFLNRNNRLGDYSCCRSLINFKYIFRFFDFDFVLFGLGFFRRWFSRRRRGLWFDFRFRNCKKKIREIKTFISYEYFKKLVISPGGGGCSTASITSTTSMGSSGSSSTSGSGVGVGVIGFSSGSDF